MTAAGCLTEAHFGTVRDIASRVSSEPGAWMEGHNARKRCATCGWRSCGISLAAITQNLDLQAVHAKV